MNKLAINGSPTDEEITKQFGALSEAEINSSVKCFNKMLELMKLYDGVRVYVIN